jgi:hypothetical protein
MKSSADDLDFDEDDVVGVQEEAVRQMRDSE